MTDIRTGAATCLKRIHNVTATLPSLTSLQPNPHWARLPLFDRKGWQRVRFGDVVENLNETCEPAAAGLERFIGLEHLEPGSLHIRAWGKVADGTTFTRRCRPGQVLFGKRRAYQRKVAVAEFDAVVSGDIYVLAPKGDRLLPELLPFLCLSERFFQHAVGTSAGSLSPRTNWSSLASFEFDLPPLDQQRRIAEILWAVDETVQKYQTTLSATKTSLRSECENCFSLNGKSKWTNVSMEDICTIQQGQVDPKQEPYSEMIHIAPDDIESESGRILERKTAREDKIISGKYEFTDEAVLYCKIRPYLKKVAFPRFAGICSADMYPLYPKENVLPEFLFHLLLSDGFTKYAISNSARSAFPELNREALFAYRLSLPPISEQEEFLSRVNSITVAVEKLGEHIKSLNQVQQQLTNCIAP